MTFNPGVAAAIVAAFSKIGMIRYLPPVFFFHIVHIAW
jgi:hypothetical protein